MLLTAAVSRRISRQKYRQLPQDPLTRPSLRKGRILASDQGDPAALDPIDDSRHIINNII
jgi:hypothetical protein